LLSNSGVGSCRLIFPVFNSSTFRFMTLLFSQVNLPLIQSAFDDEVAFVVLAQGVEMASPPGSKCSWGLPTPAGAITLNYDQAWPMENLL
jgi:hypothetical protein